MLDNQQDLFKKLIEELDSYDQNVIILKGNAKPERILQFAVLMEINFVKNENIIV